MKQTQTRREVKSDSIAAICMVPDDIGALQLLIEGGRFG